jgi:hypothetical protein
MDGASEIDRFACEMGKLAIDYRRRELARECDESHTVAPGVYLVDLMMISGGPT